MRTRHSPLPVESPADLHTSPLAYVLYFLTYTTHPLAVDFDEFCELMTRQAGGAPIEAVREAARQVHTTPVA